MKKQLIFALLSSTLSMACTMEVSSHSEELNEESVSEDASEIRIGNGDRLSGLVLSGAVANGEHLLGIQLAGMNMSGEALSDVSINGTSLNGRLPSGQLISGTDFVGTRMVGNLSGGSNVSIVILGIQPSNDSDILYYDFAYEAPDGSHTPVCGTDQNGENILGYPLAGYWDHSAGTPTGGSHIDDATRFGIACRGAAIAKCVELGYKPWAKTQECNASGDCHDVDLKDLHQACTRMIRADYCGDGASHTEIGTEVDTFDAFGLQSEDSVAWNLEAEWTQSGAQCVLHTRWVSSNYGNVASYMQAHCPSRYTPPGSGTGCGQASSTFFTENGYSVPMASRVVLRNKSEVNQ